MPSPLPDEELLSALRSAAPAPPQNLLERWQPPVATRPARSYRPWIVGLAAATVCGATLAFVPGALLRPKNTFADIEEAMLQAKTISWTEHEISGAGATRFWVDLRIPAIARKGSRSGKRTKEVSRDGHTYLIENRKDGLPYYQVASGSLLANSEFIPTTSNADQLREEIIQNVILPRQLIQGVDWKSQTEVINGQEYLKLSRRVPGDSKITPGPVEVKFIEYSFWINPKTRRVFKREALLRSRFEQRVIDSVSVCEDIRFDENLPNETFDLQPPAGSRYRYIPQPGRIITQEDHAAMAAVVQKAEKAWNAGDAATYLSLWRFDHPNDGISRAAQLAAIGNPNRQRWSTAHSPYRPGIRVSGIYTHRVGDVFPPQNPVEFGFGPWGLLKEPDGFKIVRMRFPSQAQEF